MISTLKRWAEEEVRAWLRRFLREIGFEVILFVKRGPTHPDAQPTMVTGFQFIGEGGQITRQRRFHVISLYPEDVLHFIYTFQPGDEEDQTLEEEKKP